MPVLSRLNSLPDRLQGWLHRRRIAAKNAMRDRAIRKQGIYWLADEPGLAFDIPDLASNGGEPHLLIRREAGTASPISVLHAS